MTEVPHPISPEEVGLQRVKKILCEDGFPHKDRENQQRLLDYQGLFTETYHNPTIGVLVEGTWGDKMDNREHTQAVLDHIGHDDKETRELVEGLIASSGSTETRWSRKVESHHDAVTFQVAAGVKMAEETMKALDIGKDKIHRIIVSLSTPASPFLAQYIKKTLDLPPDVDAKISCVACASSAEAFHRLVEAKPSNPSKYSLLICVESMAMFRFPFGDYSGTKDAATLSLFGDKGFCFGFQPAQWETLLTENHSEVDTEGALAGLIPTPYLRHSEPDMVIENECGIIGRIPKPKGNDMLTLNPRKTTEKFIDFVYALKDKLQQRLQEEFNKGKINTPDLSWVTYAIAHRPSELIYVKRITKHLKNLLHLGEDRFSWSLGEKPIPMNAPAATFGVEMSRIFNKIKPGDTLLTFFFGAGAYGRVSIYRIMGKPIAQNAI